MVNTGRCCLLTQNFACAPPRTRRLGFVRAHTQMKRNRDESAEDAPEPSLPSLQALDDARRAYNVGVGKQSEVAGLDWKTAVARARA